MFRNIVTACAVFMLGAVLSACTGQDVKQSLGIKRNQPDAFQVVSRPPLSVPPVYHLRPPADAPEYASNADDQARALVLDGEEPQSRRKLDDSYYAKGETAVVGVESSGLGTQAEAEFLRSAGANKAKPDIRQLLQQETVAYETEVEEQENGLLGKLNPFERKSGDPVVDAQAEAERIRKAKEEGTPLNEGETPRIDPKKESVL